MGSQAYFTPALFAFVRDLKAHNRRDWFEKNKSRYEADVKGPMLRFIADLATHLRADQPRCRRRPTPCRRLDVRHLASAPNSCC